MYKCGECWVWDVGAWGERERDGCGSVRGRGWNASCLLWLVYKC